MFAQSIPPKLDLEYGERQKETVTRSKGNFGGKNSQGRNTKAPENASCIQTMIPTLSLRASESQQQ